MNLKELIRQYPELGDVFADFETRIATLENSMPFAKDTQEDIKSVRFPIIPSEHRLSYRLQQLEGRFIHLENKVNEKRDASLEKEVITISDEE